MIRLCESAADTTLHMVAADGVDPVRHVRTLGRGSDTCTSAANSLWITSSECDTHAVTDRDIYERLGELERLVRHLYKQTGVPMPDPQALLSTAVSDNVRNLVAAGNKIGAVKAYRDESGCDLATATKVINSLYG